MASDTTCGEAMVSTDMPQPLAPACVLEVIDDLSAAAEPCTRAIALLLLAHPEFVGRINSLAAVEQCLQERLKNDRLSSASKPHETLVCLMALAQMLFRTGRTQEAEACYIQATDVVMTCVD